MKYLLLDTNVYLHYIDFEQVDWAAIVGDKEYAILVPFIVIKEIDKYKDGPKNKIKTHARAVSSKFGSYFLDDSCEKKINLIPLSEPSDDVLKINCLNRNISDDVIIASALAFEHKENIIVISHDNTLLIKAKNFGLKFIPKMPDEYLIAEEKSAEEKEYERCRKELELLKNRQPKPYLTFSDGSRELRIKVPRTTEFADILNERMAKVREEHPHIIRPQSITQIDTNTPVRIEDTFQVLLNLPYSIYSDGQLADHNKQLDRFYEYSEKYYSFKLESESLDKRLQELKFFVVNDGNSETGEMDIFLEFPQSVNLYNNNSYKYMNDIKPKAPNVGSCFNACGSGLDFSRYISPMGGLDIPKMKSWDLTKTLSNQRITSNTRTLIHNVRRKLDIEKSLYIDTAQCGNFSINWCICAAGCPEYITGVLNVIIEDN